MKALLLFTYSVVSYVIALAAIIYWILSTSNLIPEISIDRAPEMELWAALGINVLLVALFGVQHSIMARKSFKSWFTSLVPEPAERSTFVLVSGILLFFLVYNWQPLGGVIWSFEYGSVAYYAMYVLFFGGWIMMLVSSFLINHFDLFGLRQGYLQLVNKPYTQLNFKVWSLYKHVRHPLYTGCIIGIWATPQMTVTHFTFAILLTSYFVIGALYEERDLRTDFGDTYKEYMKKTSMLIPFLKFK